VRLTAGRNRLRNATNRRVGIVTGRTCNGFAGAAVAIDKPCKSGDRLVTHLWIGIRGQNLNEVSYNVGNANIVVTASLASETM